MCLSVTDRPTKANQIGILRGFGTTTDNGYQIKPEVSLGLFGIEMQVNF